MSAPYAKLPGWVDFGLIPLLNLLVAFAVAGLVVLLVGENPLRAAAILVDGAFGRGQYIAYTLYYATNFIFTGLAVAIAFHARMFNIGGEGQAAIGGIGVALVCLYVPWPHWSLALLAAAGAAALFGAGWAAIPAYLQARRGSHIVITTIMFNFIAAALLNYLLVGPLKQRGVMDTATTPFPESTHLPSFQDMFSTPDHPMFRGGPANVTFFVALLCAFLVWLVVWRTRLGYEIRAYGFSEGAARYAGIGATKIIMVSMLMSGGLAGLMAINNTMGEAERLILNAVSGAGFIGIAVALMGRNHPVGVLLAAILFGILYQGGAELALSTKIPREMVVVIQALVIMFTGALDNMVRMPVESLFRNRRARPPAAPPGPTIPDPRQGTAPSGSVVEP